MQDVEEAVREQVWAGYRYVALSESSAPEGVHVVDLGAGHASGSLTLCGRVIAALKSEALLNESVGAGYIDRNWPSALRVSGAWPLTSLRQSFQNGALTRLLDPDPEIEAHIELRATFPTDSAAYVESEVRQILEDLGLSGHLRFE